MSATIGKWLDLNLLKPIKCVSKVVALKLKFPPWLAVTATSNVCLYIGESSNKGTSASLFELRRTELSKPSGLIFILCSGKVDCKKV